jgi:hypothetical protein
MALNGAAVALAAILLVAFATWLASVARRDVGIVDSLWGPMIALGPWAYLAAIAQPGPRETLVLLLASLWMVRLSGYITWRNWGHGEDHRYQAIRARNQPHFEFKEPVSGVRPAGGSGLDRGLALDGGPGWRSTPGPHGYAGCRALALWHRL